VNFEEEETLEKKDVVGNDAQDVVQVAVFKEEGSLRRMMLWRILRWRSKFGSVA
jgi:hypothetical protein